MDIIKLLIDYLPPQGSAAMLLLTLLLITLTYFYISFKYWKTIGIPQVPPTIPLGNIKNLFLQKYSFGEFCQEIYFKLKKEKYQYGGIYIFTKPVFCVVDPKIIKLVLANNFTSFYNRGIYHDESFDPVSANLFSLDGNKWRSLRKTFTPSFTTQKMKIMFEILLKCGEEFENLLCDYDGKSIHIRDFTGRFTTDVIASCAFGIECNSLKNPNEEFRIRGKQVIEVTPIQQIKNIFLISIPKVMKYFKVPLFDKDVSDFFYNTVKQTVDFREQNNIERNDFMQMLIKLKNTKGKIDDDNISQITLNQLAAQAFVFFVAGFETSASTMGFCLYELACNQDIQSRLKMEVKEVLDKNGGVLTYEAIKEMTYMDQVVNETLRKYPPIPFLNRQCTQDFRLPDTGAIIREGTLVWISILGLHRDPEYFPEPEKFDPDRFTEENKLKIPPFVYMPFGEGPRNCIGARFGQLQVKVGLTVLLRNHRYLLDPRTPVPLIFDKTNILLSSKDIMYLVCKKDK